MVKKKFLVEIEEDELVKIKQSSDVFLNCNSFVEVLEGVIGIQPKDYPGGPEEYVVKVSELNTQTLAEKIYNKLKSKGANIGNVSIFLIKEILDKEA